MLQLDTRPSSNWTSSIPSPTFHADFVFSRLASLSSSSSRRSMRDYHQHESAEVSRLTDVKADKLIISRSSSSSREVAAKAVQPTHTGERKEELKLGLPPIRLASSARASSSPSSPSSLPSPSLLSEPHHRQRGRLAHSLSPTEPTPPVFGKRCQSASPPPYQRRAEEKSKLLPSDFIGAGNDTAARLPPILSSRKRTLEEFQGNTLPKGLSASLAQPSSVGGPNPSGEIDVESTIVLAHRAVTAIKNQALPRPKTFGPSFPPGSSGCLPFGLAGRPHDGAMYSEDESDSGSSPRSPKVMPWAVKRPKRDDSPFSFDSLPPDLTPVSAPRELPCSSPKPTPHAFGMGPLVTGMGGDRSLAKELERPSEPLSETTESNSSPERTETNGHTEKTENSNAAPAPNTSSLSISPISRSNGGSGDGDGGEDPNRRRKLSEHEQDDDEADIRQAKRRKLDEAEEAAEPRYPEPADRDLPVSGLPFGPLKRPSPPPVPSGPPTVESVPSTAATMDSGPAYSETAGTPATMCDDYHKSPVETTTNNILPPIHNSANFSPGRSSISPRATHTTLPSVNSLFTVASAAQKHPLDQHIQPKPNGGKYSSPVIVQRLNVTAPQPPSNSSNRNYVVDDFSRAIPFNDPAQQFRTMTPRSRQSPTVSPTESRNAPIAPAPATNYNGNTSPLSQYTHAYYPPKRLNRPDHHATLPPLQTDWSGSIPPSEPSSARTPTSKNSKRARNGTPKNGSIDSSQSSPTVSGGFKCNKEGCTAAPFSTQYLLNSHANVHSEDRPHFCPVAGCSRGEGGKGFKRKNEMIRHGLVHQSPGYVCPFCPDKEHRYPRPDNLQRHVKAHHKDKNGDDPLLREVLAVRPEGGQRGRRRRLGTNP